METDEPIVTGFENLSEEEQKTIMTVLKRDEQLLKKEAIRVKNLKKSFQLEKKQTLPKIIYRNPEDAKCCARCKTEFGFFFNRGNVCPKCNFKVCNNCQLENLTRSGWLCKLCHNELTLHGKTGEWFYHQGNGKITPQRMYGSAILRESFRRSLRDHHKATAVTGVSPTHSYDVTGDHRVPVLDGGNITSSNDVSINSNPGTNLTPSGSFRRKIHPENFHVDLNNDDYADEPSSNVGNRENFEIVSDDTSSGHTLTGQISVTAEIHGDVSRSHTLDLQQERLEAAQREYFEDFGTQLPAHMAKQYRASITHLSNESIISPQDKYVKRSSTAHEQKSANSSSDQHASIDRVRDDIQKPSSKYTDNSDVSEVDPSIYPKYDDNCAKPAVTIETMDDSMNSVSSSISSLRSDYKQLPQHSSQEGDSGLGSKEIVYQKSEGLLVVSSSGARSPVNCLTDLTPPSSTKSVPPYRPKRLLPDVSTLPNKFNIAQNIRKYQTSITHSRSTGPYDEIRRVSETSASQRFSVRRATAIGAMKPGLFYRGGSEAWTTDDDQRYEIRDDEVSERSSEAVSVASARLYSSNPSLNKQFSQSSESICSIYTNAGEELDDNIKIQGDILMGYEYDFTGHCLVIHLKSCRNLSVLVDRKGKPIKPDPYAKLYLLPDKSPSGKRKTRVRKSTCFPTFHDVMNFPVKSTELSNRSIYTSLWHRDRFGKNEFLGEMTIDLKCWDFESEAPLWYALVNRKKLYSEFIYHGEICLSIYFERKMKSDHGVLMVHVKFARNLIAKKKNGTSDPFIKAYLLPNRSSSGKQKSPVYKRTVNPDFSHKFSYENIEQLELQDKVLELSLWDHNRLTGNEFLGAIRLGTGNGKSYGSSVEWNDSTDEEKELWQNVCNAPAKWFEANLPLRDSLKFRNPNT